MEEVHVKAPGKLYIAGEYAVVEPGYSAILTAVDLFIHLSLTEAEGPGGTIYSAGFTDQPAKWQRIKNEIQLNTPAPALHYVLAAIQTTEAYVTDLGVPLKTYHLHLKSELDNDAGYKLGVGSSGAVTVAVVRGLLKFYNQAFTDELVYKLSVLAQLQLGVNSSFGDLAAITYTGWIKYTSFERETVRAFFEKHSVKETVETIWPKLTIERLAIPEAINFLIGWTGRPASSDQLVGAVQEKKQQSHQQYQHFLKESQTAVNQLAAALTQKNTKAMAAAIHKNRCALVQMGQETNVQIETPLLAKLCEIAQHHGGAAKTSGAGGGDSGIAFIFNEKKIAAVISDWQAAGITHLPLTIYQKSITT